MNCLLFLSIISIACITGEALICYQCIFCDDVSSAKNITHKNCSVSSSKPSCFKTDAVLTNGTTIVIARDCVSQVPVNYNNIFRDTTNKSIYVESQSAYYCDTDLCNSSESLLSTSTTTLVTMITFISAIKSLYGN
ncbi:uncharacterized protein LOC130676574 [Microplitis mediator]|uniref:uncharacterized protein LOC130676574 n=1 Tax=Microplitis mediator TaxID=375433 RepID=UPI0025535A04|nr:uncharacterized protein LOC130676574 [Microplitis mediator]